MKDEKQPTWAKGLNKQETALAAKKREDKIKKSAAERALSLVEGQKKQKSMIAGGTIASSAAMEALFYGSQSAAKYEVVIAGGAVAAGLLGAAYADDETAASVGMAVFASAGSRLANKLVRMGMDKYRESKKAA